jgi:hypothetical protein
MHIWRHVDSVTVNLAMCKPKVCSYGPSSHIFFTSAPAGFDPATVGDITRPRRQGLSLHLINFKKKKKLDSNELKMSSDLSVIKAFNGLI